MTKIICPGRPAPFSPHILSPLILLQRFWKGEILWRILLIIVPINFKCRQPTHIARFLSLLLQYLQWSAASAHSLMWVRGWELKFRGKWKWKLLDTEHPSPFQVWNVCIALQSTPRLLFARMYYRYFKVPTTSFRDWHGNSLPPFPQDRLSLGSATPRLVSFNFGLNIVENLSLLGLSFVPSSDVFELHEAFFITFMATSMISMVLTMFYLYPHCGFQARSGDERRAIGYKKRLVKTSLGAAVLALYFYWRHNEYCEPYVYSFFGLFEYVIVLCNIGYHGMVSLDFADSSVRTGPDQILLK